MKMCENDHKTVFMTIILTVDKKILPKIKQTTILTKHTYFLFKNTVLNFSPLPPWIFAIFIKIIHIIFIYATRIWIFIVILSLPDYNSMKHIFFVKHQSRYYQGLSLVICIVWRHIYRYYELLKNDCFCQAK